MLELSGLHLPCIIESVQTDITIPESLQSETSFFKLIFRLPFHVPSLNQQDQTLISGALTSIWTSMLKKTNPIEIPTELKTWLQTSDNIKILFHIMIQARNHSIKKSMSVNNTTPEEILISDLETRARRFHFMLVIKNNLPEIVLFPELEGVRNCFVTAIVSDLTTNIDIIGSGLYENIFKKEYKKLKTYFKDAAMTVEKLRDSIFDNPKHYAATCILKYMIALNLYQAKYHFSYGHYEKAYLYLDALQKNSERLIEDVPNITELANANYGDLGPLLVEAQKTLRTDIEKNDYQRKWLLSIIEKIKNCRANPPAKKDLSYRSLSTYIGVLESLPFDKKSIKIIDKLIRLIHAAYLNNYDNKLNILMSAENILLQFLVRLIAYPPHHVLVDKITRYFNPYFNAINKIRDRLNNTPIESNTAAILPLDEKQHTHITVKVGRADLIKAKKLAKQRLQYANNLKQIITQLESWGSQRDIPAPIPTASTVAKSTLLIENIAPSCVGLKHSTQLKTQHQEQALLDAKKTIADLEETISCLSQAYSQLTQESAELQLTLSQGKKEKINSEKQQLHIQAKIDKKKQKTEQLILEQSELIMRNTELTHTNAHLELNAPKRAIRLAKQQKIIARLQSNIAYQTQRLALYQQRGAALCTDLQAAQASEQQFQCELDSLESECSQQTDELQKKITRLNQKLKGVQHTQTKIENESTKTQDAIEKIQQQILSTQQLAHYIYNANIKTTMQTYLSCAQTIQYLQYQIEALSQPPVSSQSTAILERQPIVIFNESYATTSRVSSHNNAQYKQAHQTKP